MGDELRDAAERVLGSVTKGVDRFGTHCRNDVGGQTWGLSEPYELAAAYLRDHPADDGEPVSEDWLRAVVPGFEMTSAAGVGGSWPADGFRLMVHRQPGGDVWGVTLSSPDGEGSVRCRTRGHVRRLCVGLGFLLPEGRTDG